MYCAELGRLIESMPRRSGRELNEGSRKLKAGVARDNQEKTMESALSWSGRMLKHRYRWSARRILYQQESSDKLV